MKPLLCIHHHPCADGFGSAWVVNKFCKENGISVEFHPGIYQNPPPDCNDRHVLLVDFSYKMDVLAQMHHQSKSLLVLDHHKTAQDDLSVLPLARPISEVVQDWRTEAYYSAQALFDMERSGAGITWDYFYPGVPRPKLIDHIEDRDLWRWALPKSREINANVFSYPYDFIVWDYLVSEDINVIALGGEAIERKHHKDIGELLEIVTRPMKFKVPTDFNGFTHVKNTDGSKSPLYSQVIVPVANLPYTLTSDAGHALCERGFDGTKHPEGAEFPKHSFAACYWDTPAGRQFSLRSRDDGANVGEIAKLYGGGGHPHAAGFRVPHSDLAQFEP